MIWRKLAELNCQQRILFQTQLYLSCTTSHESPCSVSFQFQVKWPSCIWVSHYSAFVHMSVFDLLSINLIKLKKPMSALSWEKLKKAAILSVVGYRWWMIGPLLRPHVHQFDPSTCLRHTKQPPPPHFLTISSSHRTGIGKSNRWTPPLHHTYTFTYKFKSMVYGT